MAIYTTNVLADNSPAAVGAGSFSTAGPSSVLGMDSMSITLFDPALGYATYLGSFSYTYSGGYQYLSWPGSTLNGITTYDLNWGVMDFISGLSIPGSTYESYALNNDVLGLIAYFFAGNDTINGSSFNDMLWGYAGDDTIDGGAGADTLVGGGGNDTYGVDNASDVVTENLNEGIDTVQSIVSYTLGANIENLTLTWTTTGWVDGTGNDLDNILIGNEFSNILSGGAGADTLDGGSGHDTLDGGLGADVMTGGGGSDTYVVDNIGDVISPEFLYGGGDTVRSSIDYTIVDYFENLVLTGAAEISGTGNVLDNALTGNDAANMLDGGGGNDILHGGAGNDTLIGGQGVDSFFGGAGDDTYFVDDTPPATMLTIIGEPGDYVSGGLNTTFTSDVISWQVYADRYNAPSPNGIAQVQVYGNDFSLSVGTGWRGVDFTPGIYSTSDLSFNFGMQGRGEAHTGSVEIQSIVADLSGGLQSFSMTFSVRYLYASENGQGLHGTLRYNSPVSTLGEQVTELANEGTDHVVSSVSYALSDNVENLTLSGNAAIDGAGNTLSNVLTGNSNNNTLTGGGGNDVFAFAASGNGIDTITDFAAGDSISVTGAAFSGIVMAGDGSTLLSNQVQIASAGGVTTLLIGTDAVAGADVQVQLTGTYSASDFSLSGDRIYMNTLPTGGVSITGAPFSGYPLTASNTLADVDGLGAIAYQWHADGVAINGATNSTYIPTQADIGKVISVAAGYVDGHGAIESVVSNGVTIVTPPTSKYFITQSAGDNLIRFDLAQGAMSLQGEEIVFTGTNGVDNVTVAPGLKFDFTKSNGGIDNLYLTGNLADYSTAFTTSTLTLTRGAGASAETVLLAKGTSTNYDTVVFANGSVSSFDLHGWASGGAVPTLGAAPALPSTLNATIKGFALDAAGEVFTGTSPGINFIATGGNGVDIVYAKTGGAVDASKLNSGEDKIYFTGNWADYTKVATTSKITFTGITGETVIVAAATGASNDRLVFADGYVLSNDAKTALLADVAAPLSTIAGYSTAEVTPLGTGASAGGTANANLYGVADISYSMTVNGPDTITGFIAAPVANGGDVLDLSAIANLADAVATGQTLTTDFAAANVFIFDATPVAIADAANAIATDVSVVATQGYIVIADVANANANAVTVYHSTDLATNGTETALVILSGVSIAQLTAENFLV